MHTVRVTGNMLRMVCVMMLLKMLLSNSHCGLVDFQTVFDDEKHLMDVTKTDIHGF